MEASVSIPAPVADVRPHGRRMLSFIMLAFVGVAFVLSDALSGQLGLFSFFSPSGPTLQVSSPVCGAWELEPVPFAGFGTDIELSGIAATPSGEIWAVGNVSKLIGEGYHPAIAYWEGNHWRMIGLPDVHAETASLDSVYFVGDEDGWAVGHSNVPGPGVLAMHWNGWNWSLVPTPPVLGALGRVRALSANDAWAVGWQNMAQPLQEFPLVMRWDGTNWQEIKLPDTLANAHATLSDVLPLAKDNVWAIGGYNWAGHKEPLILHWDGNNWTTPPSPAQCSGQHYLSALSAAGANDIWAVGSCDDGDPTVRQKLVQHWDGTLWTLSEVANPQQKSGTLTGVVALSSNDVWSVGTHNYDRVTAFIQHWDGSKWQPLPHPPIVWSPQSGQDVVTLSSSELWLLGYGYSGSHSFIAQFLRCS